MRILYCSSEVYPYSKTGGLADVAGSLPKAMAELGHDVVVMTPKYLGTSEDELNPVSRLQIIFIENDEYFARAGIYGDENGDYPDNADRYAFFCREIIKTTRAIGFSPDIIHLNDWQTGLVPLYLQTVSRDVMFFGRTQTVFTIHNLAYQGNFGMECFPRLDLPSSALLSGDLEFYGRMSFLKAGLVYADHLTTVSKTYAKEILTEDYGCGMQGVILSRKKPVHGILNGLDYSVWNPATDKTLSEYFDAGSLGKKSVNKKDLSARLGWAEAPDKPLFGMVARLAEQKGFDLVMETFEEIMKRDLRLVILATGEEKYRSFFESMNTRYPDRFRAILKFEGDEASRIYAASDFFLMPSRYEPCGLGQLISFRYGTLPVVFRTGGLADTVIDYRSAPRSGTGVVFDRFTAVDWLKALDAALDLHRRPDDMDAARRRVMNLDYSWRHSAQEYHELFKKIRDDS